MKIYCAYCKDEIRSDTTYIVASDGKKYHIFCYRQMNTYIDEFEKNSTDEFGENRAEEYGY